MTAYRYLVMCREELRRAQWLHARPFANSLEGLGVLLEEVDEFWDEVKRKEHDDVRLVDELVQVGAMLLRIGKDICGDEPETVIDRVQATLFSPAVGQKSWHGLYGLLVRAVMATNQLNVVTVLSECAATVDALTPGILPTLELRPENGGDHDAG
jgi:hypothetical protein